MSFVGITVSVKSTPPSNSSRSRCLFQSSTSVRASTAHPFTRLLPYSGGERVARIVTQAAARHLTPVTLEVRSAETLSCAALPNGLPMFVCSSEVRTSWQPGACLIHRMPSGKNPVVVDPRVDPVFTAKRILWGRFGNAGQVSSITHLSRLTKLIRLC